MIDSNTDTESSNVAEELAAPNLTASWYARRDEERHRQMAALSAALLDLIHGFKKSLNFRDLQIIEMIFYCQLRNKDVARINKITEQHVALIKHRCIKHIRERIERELGPEAESFSEPGDAMLSQIWQQQRLSCLKRSTIGAYLLGTLDQPWHDYVSFHLHQLGCRFCRANLEDLQLQGTGEQAQVLRDRILESTAVSYTHLTLPTN